MIYPCFTTKVANHNQIVLQMQRRDTKSQDLNNKFSCVELHIMKSADIIKRLESEGWILVRVKGSHHQFKHPDKLGLVTVPHPRTDIMIGTLRSIYRQADWKWR